MGNIDLKKFTRIFSFLGDRDPGKAEITPHRDWIVLVGIFVALMVAVAGASALLFMQTGDEGLSAAEETQPKSKIFNVKRLSSVISEFEDRETKLQELRTERPHTIDPSE